ncbi:MAG: PhzF family phenazine biosynthesis protein [Paracoccaceae bacterium]
MAAYACDWVDAFTTRAFGGNACVVVYGADDISLDNRMRLVRETSLSECAFLVASDLADFGVRYYLAGREILMAGHPTIATVVSLVSRGKVTLVNGHADFTLEVGAGVLPISVSIGDDDTVTVTMTQLKPEFGNQHDLAEIADIFGLTAGDIQGVPQTVSTGSAFCITVLTSKDALKRASLNVDKLQAYKATENDDFFEPFLVCLGGETPDGDVYSRLLLPPPMPAEDPFTGSATGCMAAYLWANNLIQTPAFTAEQGHWLGRPGSARVEVLGPQGDISGVKVAGAGYILMSGELYL